MSNVYLEAAEAVEREAARAASLAGVAADLRRVGSLQQAADEAQARLDRIGGELDEINADAKARTAQAEADLKGAQERLVAAQAAITEAQRQASAIADNAAKDAKATRDQAEADAARMITEGRTAEDTLVSQALAKAASYQPAIDAAQAELDGLNTAIATAQSTLADMERDRVAMIEKLSR